MFDEMNITNGLYLIYSNEDKNDFHICEKKLFLKDDFTDKGKFYFCEGLLEKRLISVEETEKRSDLVIDFIDKEVLVQNGVNVITKKVDIEYHGTETANYVLKNDFKKYVNDYLNKKEVSKKIL